MGEIVNVDGDRAASFIASALNADILISLTDVEGIYKDFKDKGSIIKQINSNELEKLTDKLEGGMKKKTYAAMEAMKIGIRKVIICSGLSQNPILDALEKNAGTVISIE
jgi:carbamate kinase